MFGTKKVTVKLEGFTLNQGITLINGLAKSSEFMDLTFGLNQEATRMTVKGPRASVNRFMAVAKSLEF